MQKFVHFFIPFLSTRHFPCIQFKSLDCYNMFQCVAVLAATLLSLGVNAWPHAATEKCQPSLDLWLNEAKNWDTSMPLVQDCFASLVGNPGPIETVYSTVCGNYQGSSDQQWDRLDSLNCVQNESSNWDKELKHCNC